MSLYPPNGNYWFPIKTQLTVSCQVEYNNRWLRYEVIMAFKEDRTAKFAKILNSACDKHGIPVRGRAGYIRSKLPYDLSVVAIRKWLNGDAIPDTKRLADIANIVGSSIEELLGMNPIHSVKELSSTDHKNIGFVSARQVPIISWVRAGDFCSSETQVMPQDCEMILCPEASASDQTFALRVVGDSMTAPFGRSYPEGTIIFVDPKKEALPGMRVVASTVKGQTFKQLVENEFGEIYLKPLNPAHHLLFEEGIEICGVVIGSYNPE